MELATLTQLLALPANTFRFEENLPTATAKIAKQVITAPKAPGSSSCARQAIIVAPKSSIRHNATRALGTQPTTPHHKVTAKHVQLATTARREPLLRSSAPLDGSARQVPPITRPPNVLLAPIAAVSRLAYLETARHVQRATTARLTPQMPPASQSSPFLAPQAPSPVRPETLRHLIAKIALQAESAPT